MKIEIAQERLNKAGTPWSVVVTPRKYVKLLDIKAQQLIQYDPRQAQSKEIRVIFEQFFEDNSNFS